MKNYIIKVAGIVIDDLTKEQAKEYFQRKVEGDVFKVMKVENGKTINVNF